MKSNAFSFNVALLLSCGLFGTFLSTYSWAQRYSSVQLTDSLREQIPLNNGGLYVWRQTGPGTLASVEESLRNGSFRPLAQNWIRGDVLDAPYWFYIKIRSAGAARQLLLVVTEDVQVLECFQRQTNRWQLRYRDGMLTSMSRRTVPNMYFLFPIALQAGQETELLVKGVNPTRFFVAKFELWDAISYSVKDHTSYFKYGIFTGFILIAAIFSLFCFITLRDRTFVYYCAYIVSAGIVVLGNTGLTAEYLWHSAPQFTLHERDIFISMAVGWQVLFVGAFIRQDVRRIPFIQYTNGFALVCLILSVLRFVYFLSGLPITPAFLLYVDRPLFEATLIGYLVSILTIIGHQCWLGNRYAWYYAWVHSIFLVVLISQTLSRLKLIKSGIFLESFIIAIIIEVVALAMGLAYRYHDLRRRRLLLEKDLVQTQRELLQAEENERQRIAQDLHDDVGNTLAAAKGALSKINQKLLIQTDFPEVTNASRLLEKAGQDLRAISHNLMPVDFEKKELTTIIQQAVEQVNSISPVIRFDYVQAGAVQKFKSERSLVIYRIINELINNILKHSGAHTAVVQLLFQSESLVITVEDDGIGIQQTSSVPSTSGIGLKNITSRVNYIGARVDISSTKTGTCVIVEVPYV